MSKDPVEIELEQWPAFDWSGSIKASHLLNRITFLEKHHRVNCEPYRKIAEGINKDKKVITSIDQMLALPVRMFKHNELRSCDQENVVKTMLSSGTTGQDQSKIFLDKETSAMQTRVLAKIMANFIGSQRLPMLVIDCQSTVKDRTKFSARTAGILGFSMFGRDTTFALTDDLKINYDAIDNFLQKHNKSNILIFGFTFIVWQHFLRALEKSSENLTLDRGILIHGGGWKKLAGEAVEADQFKKRLKAVSGISRVHNYYGMVEQTGSIFMECEAGYFHASSWSDIIIRDPITLDTQPQGQQGLIQLLSALPLSYPGHSILSEDLGTIHGQDNCSCGRKGVYFSVSGRLKQAEARGCSDTFQR